MKKLLSVFMASALLLGATNPIASADGGMRKPTGGCALSDEDIRAAEQQAIQLFLKDERKRETDGIIFGSDQVTDVTFDRGKFAFGGTVNMLTNSLQGNPLWEAYYINTGIPNSVASIIPTSAFSDNKEDIIQPIEQLARILALKYKVSQDFTAASSDDIANSVYLSIINSNLKACGKDPLLKLFINEYKLYSVLNQLSDDLPRSGPFQQHYFVIIEDLNSTDPDSHFHVSVMTRDMLA